MSRPGTQLPPTVAVQQAIDVSQRDLLSGRLADPAMKLFRGEHPPTPGFFLQRGQ